MAPSSASSDPNPPAARALAALARQIEDDAALLATLPADVVAAETDPDEAAALLARIQDVSKQTRAAARPPIRHRGGRLWRWGAVAAVVGVAAVSVLRDRPDTLAALGSDAAVLEALAAARPPTKGAADPAARALAEGARALLAAWDVPDPPDSVQAAHASADFERAFELTTRADTSRRADEAAFFAGKALLAARRPDEARRWLARVDTGPHADEAARLVREIPAPR